MSAQEEDKSAKQESHGECRARRRGGVKGRLHTRLGRSLDERKQTTLVNRITHMMACNNRSLSDDPATIGP